MPKIMTLINCVNSFNFILLEDAGENYNIKMHSILGKKEGDPPFSKLDGTPTDKNVYWVTVPKITKQVLY